MVNDSNRAFFEVATAMYPEQHLYVITGENQRCWFNPIPHPGYSVEALHYTRRTIQGNQIVGLDAFAIYGLPRGGCMPFENVCPDDENTICLWTITKVMWEGGYPSFEGTVHVTERRGFGGLSARRVQMRRERLS